MAERLGNVYELYQIQELPMDQGQVFKVAHEIVFCSEINLEDVLDCYGYENLEQVKTEYGDDWEAILAECQFELNASCLENLITQEFLTYDEAKQLICRVSGYEGEKTLE